MNLSDLVIPPQLKIALGIGGVLAVLLAGYLVYKKIDGAGYDRCVTEHKLDTAAAKDKARENVVKVEKSYAPKIKELNEAPDNGSVVGPLTTHAIDGL